jgi:hypothetical protein
VVVPAVAAVVRRPLVPRPPALAVRPLPGHLLLVHEARRQPPVPQRRRVAVVDGAAGLPSR